MGKLWRAAGKVSTGLRVSQISFNQQLHVTLWPQGMKTPMSALTGKHHTTK